MPSPRRAPRRVRNEQGFTFIEVLIAAIVLIVVAYALTQFYFRGRKHMDYEEDRRKATAVAQERLDDARRWSYDYLGSLALTNGSNDTTMVVDGRTYTVSLSVHPHPDPRSPNQHSTVVDATVRWDSMVNYNAANTFERTHTATTIVARAFPVSGVTP